MIRFVFLLALLIPIQGRAQFVSEKNRVTTPEYVHFFHRRFHDWYLKNIYSFDKLSQEERSFMSAVTVENDVFGEWRDNKFLRAFSYAVLSDKSTAKNYMFSFLNLLSDSGLKEKIKSIAIARKVKWGSLPEYKISGLILHSDPDKFSLQFLIENIEKETSAFVPGKLSENRKGPAVLRLHFFKGSLQSTSVLFPGVTSERVCPPVIGVAQIDEVVSESSAQLFWYVVRAEPRALSQESEKILETLRRGMNMEPGMISCRADQSYEIVMP